MQGNLRNWWLFENEIMHAMQWQYCFIPDWVRKKTLSPVVIQ